MNPQQLKSLDWLLCGMMRGEGAYEKASAVVKTYRWED